MQKKRKQPADLSARAVDPEILSVEEDTLALQGGLKGRFAREFCVLQGSVEALGRYLDLHADPTVRGEVAPLLRQMQEQILRLERLADHAADLALHSPQLAVGEPAALGLAGLLRDFCTAANAEMLHRGSHARLTLEVEPGAEPTLLWGQEGRINELLSNLVSNTVNACPDAAITLSLTADRRLLYRDNGPGLPPWAAPLLLGAPENAESLHRGATGLLMVAACAGALGWQLAQGTGEGFALDITLPALERAPVLVSAHESDAARIRRQTDCLRRELDATLPAP